MLSAVSAVLYILLSIRGWFEQVSKWQGVSGVPRRAYFCGLTFALLFYYGFPLWWWRYGLWKALHLVFVCVGAVAVLQAILRTTGSIEVESLGESIVVALLLSMPIRAIGGIWVACRDAEWRSAIRQRRQCRLQRAIE